MSTRYFCNACDSEMVEQSTVYVVNGRHGVGIAEFRIGPVENKLGLPDFHICRHCLIDAIKRTDDRSEKAP